MEMLLLSTNSFAKDFLATHQNLKTTTTTTTSHSNFVFEWSFKVLMGCQEELLDTGRSAPSKQFLQKISEKVAATNNDPNSQMARPTNICQSLQGRKFLLE